MHAFYDKLKKAWKSWVIWFNGASAAFILGWPTIQDQLPQLNIYLSDADVKKLTLAILLVNIALRFKTNNSLAQK